MNVFLDLDETIISAISTKKFKNGEHDGKVKQFKSHNMDDYYFVFERPGLEKFLDFLFSNFNVSVWTAASKDYALFIVDKVILNKRTRKLDYLFFSYHCDVSNHLKDGIKDMSLLWDIYELPGYTGKNTIIIDDNDEVEKTGFCFQVDGFDFLEDGSENDSHLLKVREKLERALDSQKKRFT